MSRSKGEVIKGVRLGFIRDLIRCHIGLSKWVLALRSMRLNSIRLFRLNKMEIYFRYSITLSRAQACNY